MIGDRIKLWVLNYGIFCSHKDNRQSDKALARALLK